MHQPYNVSRLLLIYVYFFLINTFTKINIDSSAIALYVFSYQFSFSKMFNNNNNNNNKIVFWTIIVYSFRINTDKHLLKNGKITKSYLFPRHIKELKIQIFNRTRISLELFWVQSITKHSSKREYLSFLFTIVLQLYETATKTFFWERQQTIFGQSTIRVESLV